MSLNKSALFACVLVASTITVYTQTYNVRLLDVKRGLPSSQVYDTHVDKTGVVWIATQDGLCRWNGAQIETFLPSLEDSTSILNQRCHSILEGKDGRLRFTSINGISTFDRGRGAFSQWTPNGRRSSEVLKGTPLASITDSLLYNQQLAGTAEAPINQLCNLKNNSISTARIRVPGATRVVNLDGWVEMIADKLGRVWASSSYGVALMDVGDSVFKVKLTVPAIPSEPPGRRLSLIADDGNYAWLFDMKLYEIYRVNLQGNGSLTRIELPPELSSGNPRPFCALSGSRLAMKNDHGQIAVLRYSGSKFISIDVTNTAEVAEQTRAWSIESDLSVYPLSDEQNTIWWAGYNGLFSYNVQTKHYQYTSLLNQAVREETKHFIRPIHVDRSGRIIAYQFGVGVLVADPARPSALVVDNWDADVGSCVAVDEDVSMAFLHSGNADVCFVHNKTGQRVYYRITDKRLIPCEGGNTTSAVPSVRIRGAYRARDGRIWAGTYRAIYAFWPRERSVQKYTISAGANAEFNSELVERFGEASDGRLWALTDYGSYTLNSETEKFDFKAPKDKFREFTLQDATVALIPSTDGKKWVHGYREIGVMKSDGSIETVALEPTNAQTELLASIKYVSMIDKGRAIIVDRRGVALVDLAKKTFERIRSPFVAIGRQPYLGGQRDHEGRIWLVATTHVEYFDLKTMRFRLVPLEGRNGALHVTSTFFPRVANTMRIWLRHADGLEILDPASLPVVRADVTLQFTTLLTSDTVRPLYPWLNDRDTISISYNDSPFIIQYSTVDLSYGEHLRFRYLLEGYDRHWIEATSSRSSRYQNVGPGKYMFRVQIFDVDGQWKEPRQPLTVIITPAWWQTIWLKFGSILVIGLAGFGFYRTRVRNITARNHELERLVSERTRELSAEQERSEGLLLNVLPALVAKRLKDGERQIADSYTDTSILFADLVGFTPLTSSLEPREIVRILNDMFSRFDRLAREHGIERIKTIGDGYMAAAGVPNPKHAQRMAWFALDMMSAMQDFSRESGYDIHLRIGINSGDVVAAVIGESRFAYDLWGDAVNVAARMETTCEVDRIHCSSAFIDALRFANPSGIKIIERGQINIKGKGEMHTFWIERKQLS